MMPAIDLTIARESLALLAGPFAAVLTFQTLDDDALRKDDMLAHVLHGTLDDLATKLIQLNDAGAGVFVAVNETDLRGRRTENVTGLRSLFIDKDDGPPGEFAIEPNLIVGREDPARHHAYWLLVPGEPLGLFTPAQKALATYYDSDRSVHDLPRVLRVPGFLWRKEAPPQLVSILRRGPAIRRSIEEILRAHRAWPLPARDSMGQVAYRSHGVSSNHVRRCRTYLATLPPSLSGARGHNALFRAACECARFALTEEEAQELLAGYWNREKTGIAAGAGSHHRAEWSPAEIQHKIAGAYRDVRARGDFGCRLGERRRRARAQWGMR